MPIWQTPAIQADDNLFIEVSATTDGIAVSYGDGVWVNNFLIRHPERAIEFGSALHEGAIQCRAMRGL
jgi:hypothetical protein